MAAAKSKGTHSVAEWFNLCKEFDLRCVICGNFPINLTKDHILPIFLGGSDSIINIQPACASCNSSKGRDFFNWKEYRREHGFK